MTRLCQVLVTVAALALLVSVLEPKGHAQQAAKRSGTTFLSPSLQEQQRDDGANPGMLWVSQGKQIWQQVEGTAGKSCASCHGAAEDSMKGVAAHYPVVDAASGELLNIELRINKCRTQHQKAAAFAYEANELLALTSYVAFQSRGVPISVRVDGAAAPYFEAGRTFFHTREGQLDLACSQCHDDNVGRHLRGDVISQGQPTGFPIYRLEWQSVGSLHRRLRACSLGVRAHMFDYGAPEYLALELYLAWRAQGLEVETPAIRR
jgi:sulfur-oxidizing protein SoxA